MTIIIRLRFVERHISRYGTLRYYFRKSKGPRTRLPDEPISAEFLEAYAAALAAAGEGPMPTRRHLDQPFTASRLVRRQIREVGGVGAIYFVQMIGSQQIKIGFSTDVLSRIASLATACPEPLDVLGAIRGTMTDERNLHHKFARYRRKGEWFDPVPEIRAYIEDALRLPGNSVLDDGWSDYRYADHEPAKEAAL